MQSTSIKVVMNIDEHVSTLQANFLESNLFIIELQSDATYRSAAESSNNGRGLQQGIRGHLV
jgi:hypothetical protein